MFYGLVHFPDIDVTPIQRIRRRYDPTVALIPPHITVMFLVPDSVGKGRLTRHLEEVLKTWHTFPIRLRGLRKSWDHWLLLTVEDGCSELARLYTDLYSGILEEYRRDDLELIPHVSLGLFVKQAERYDFEDPQELEFDEPRYRNAVQEAEALGLDFRCELDRLTLIGVSKDFARSSSITEWRLCGTDA